jgi:hypothetical protein
MVNIKVKASGRVGIVERCAKGSLDEVDEAGAQVKTNAGANHDGDKDPEYPLSQLEDMLMEGLSRWHYLTPVKV